MDQSFASLLVSKISGITERGESISAERINVAWDCQPGYHLVVTKCRRFKKVNFAARRNCISNGPLLIVKGEEEGRNAHRSRLRRENRFVQDQGFCSA